MTVPNFLLVLILTAGPHSVSAVEQSRRSFLRSVACTLAAKAAPNTSGVFLQNGAISNEPALDFSEQRVEHYFGVYTKLRQRTPSAVWQKLYGNHDACSIARQFVGWEIDASQELSLTHQEVASIFDHGFELQDSRFTTVRRAILNRAAAAFPQLQNYAATFVKNSTQEISNLHRRPNSVRTALESQCQEAFQPPQKF